mgnify:CR=1 FL=1
MNYRPEIDGLRAFAVIPVFLYHAGINAFSGGYVGVDVFFVISGYLISTIIFNDLHDGRFSIRTFYERRARRILPALFVVILICLPIAWWILLPYDAKSFSRSVFAVSTFTSNILFWRESGYFGTVGELKPLLHTWSLAVEEQYYILFPVAMVFLFKRGDTWVLAALITTFLASIGLGIWVGQNDPSAAFYLMPTRMWELMLGAFVAFHHRRQKILGYAPNKTTPLNNIGAAAGLIGIVYAFVQFDETNAFPSLSMLVPTIATAALLHFAVGETITAKLLRAKVLVGLGLISYSSYLWHQPLFAFARHASDSMPSHATLLGLALCSLGLAYLTWRFIEQPFRNKRLFSSRQILASSVIGSSILLAVGVIGIASNGFDYRNPPNINWSSLAEKRGTLGPVCDRQEIKGFDGVRPCVFGDDKGRVTIGLYGDSHAQSISYFLDTRFKEKGVRGILFLKPVECRVIPYIIDKFENADIEKCSRSYSNTMSYIQKNIDSVIVASRWTSQLYPIDGTIDSLNFDNGEGGIEYGSYTEYLALTSDGKLSKSSVAKEAAIEHFLNTLNATGRPIYLLFPIPEVGWNIYKKNYRHYQNDNNPLDHISTSYDLYQSRNKFVLNIFKRTNKYNNIVNVRSDHALCNSFIADRCVAQLNGTPFYLDDDHLSDAGAALILDGLWSLPLFSPKKNTPDA